MAIPLTLLSNTQESVLTSRSMRMSCEELECALGAMRNLSGNSAPLVPACTCKCSQCSIEISFSRAHTDAQPLRSHTVHLAPPVLAHFPAVHTAAHVHVTQV